MMITMVVGLYTSRVILQILGVSDFGIYNVVGGVVAMLGLITNTMASASQRFLAFEIGRGDLAKLARTFSVTMTIYVAFAILVLLLGETIGLWFIHHKLSVPPQRLTAVLWVYQFSLAAFILSILRIPYNAAIIAHEKMDFFAWSSIIEVTLKLLIVFMLTLFQFDKLILYSILISGVVMTVSSIYYIYCRIKFDECTYRYRWDRTLLQSMFSFAGWSFFDSIANVGMSQGVNIMLNMFFGPAVNAARGIAFQISSQVASFVYNFQTATAPQLIKYQAAEQRNEMKKLYYRSSRLSYFLLFLITLPVLLETDTLLRWWLRDVPDYTSIFARLVLINKLVDCLVGTSNQLIQATGNIKYYQIFSGISMFLNLPISYVFLNQGFPPQMTFFVSILISFILLMIRLIIVQKQLSFPMTEYLHLVVLKNIVVSIFAALLPFALFLELSKNVYSFLLVCLVSTLTSSIFIFSFGLYRNERSLVTNFIRSKIIKA